MRMQGFRGWFVAACVAASGMLFTSSVALADERTEARRDFREGMRLIAAREFEAGIELLTRAYDTLPHPNVLYNIALAYLYSGRPDEALEYFERYKETAPASGQVEVEPLIATLRQNRVSPPPPAPTPAQGMEGSEGREPAVQTDKKPSPAASDMIATIEAAARELRKVAKASESPALQRQADDLEAAAKRLRQEREAAAGPVSQASPLPQQPQSTPPRAAPVLTSAQGARQGVYDEVVVSASRFSQSPLDAPNATAIITAQDIRLTGLTDVGQLLRRVAGVEVTSVSPNHVEVSIRGLNRRTSNKVLLLLDGRSLRQDFLGSAWYNFLPVSIEDIERIEIIRGPASALYGADAFSGIINIITRTPGEGGSFIVGGLGNHDQGRGVASFNGREGKLSYHFGAGYSQADNAVLPVGKDRVDQLPLTGSPDVASKKVWGNGEIRYPLARRSLVTMGGNIVYGDQTVQGLSRLLQVAVDDTYESQVYGSITTPVGLRLATWWNHLDGNAGISYLTPGAVDVVAYNVLQNVNDVDLSFTRSFMLGVQQNLTVGAGYRYKAIQLAWLDKDHTQHHVGAYIQDVLQLARPLRLQLGARVDRHPLLSSLQFSPRGSLVYRFLPDQSVRATVGRAFRGPSFLESYVEFPNAAPLRGVTAWGVGNDNLAPESITSFELGYMTQASDSFALEINGYYNLVKDAILFTEVDKFGLNDFADPDSSLAKYDTDVDAFPISSLRFVNERATFRQLGGEFGTRFYPVTGLDVYSNYAIHDTAPTDKNAVDPERAKEQQTSLHKVNAGLQYRARFGLDSSLDLSWVSKQVWIEQVTDVNTGVRFESYAVPSFLLVNGRVGYRLFNDRVELGVVGTNLTFNRQRQHPFGQPMDTRVMALGKLRF